MKNTDRRIGGERGVPVLLEAAELLITEREFMLSEGMVCPKSAMARELAKTHGFKVIDIPLAKVGSTEAAEELLRGDW